MICTEEEAKTKWCPMAQVMIMPHGDKISAVSNRDISLMVPTNSFDPATDITKCIASACMMWQTVKGIEAYNPDAGNKIDWIKKHRAEVGSSLKEAVDAANSGEDVKCGGYCGLAGKV